MDLTSPIPNSDNENESDTDVLVLDTDYDFPTVEDCQTTSINHNNIGTVWRDMVVGEEIEGCLTHLEVTTKTTSYTDFDDPNYKSKPNNLKRKRVLSSNKTKRKKKNKKISEKDFDLESNNHNLKRRYSYDNINFTECNNYQYIKKKNLIEKRGSNGLSLGLSLSRTLPNINDIDLMSINEIVDVLCINLHERNKNLMLSVISKLDKSIIIAKYNQTCLIESMGGEMIKDGNRRRTSGGIFFNLIKQDKSIPNSIKKPLFGCSQNEQTKKKKRQEKMKRRKEKLKKIIDADRKKDDDLKKINEDLEIKFSNDISENDETIS